MPVPYRFEFVGGSRHGHCSTGFEAYGHYVATNQAALGGQLRLLSLDALKQIHIEGLTGDVTYEIYEVIEHRVDDDATVAICRFMRSESAS